MGGHPPQGDEGVVVGCGEQVLGRAKVLDGDGNDVGLEEGAVSGEKADSMTKTPPWQ